MLTRLHEQSFLDRGPVSATFHACMLTRLHEQSFLDRGPVSATFHACIQERMLVGGNVRAAYVNSNCLFANAYL